MVAPAQMPFEITRFFGLAAKFPDLRTPTSAAADDGPPTGRSPLTGCTAVAGDVLEHVCSALKILANSDAALSAPGCLFWPSLLGRIRFIVADYHRVRTIIVSGPSPCPEPICARNQFLVSQLLRVWGRRECGTVRLPVRTSFRSFRTIW